MTAECNICWFAARTRYGQELGIRDRLDALGVENFIPTDTVKNYRGKLREKPVISNLVFIRTTKKQACDLKVFSGLPLNYLMDPAAHSMLVVPDKQMDDFIRVFNVSRTEGGLVNENLVAGERVRVIEGPLKGVEGYVLEILGDYYVAVGLCCSVYVRAQVPRAWLETIDRKEN